MLREGARRSDCLFERDRELGWLGGQAYFTNEERGAANLLALSARYSAMNGDVDAAAVDVKTLLRMGRQLTNRPGPVDALIGTGIESLGRDEAERLLPMIFRTQQLDEFATDDLPSIPDCLARSLLGERCDQLNEVSQFPAAYFNLNPIERFDQSSTLSNGPAIVYLIDLDRFDQASRELRRLMLEPFDKAKPRVRELCEDPANSLFGTQALQIGPNYRSMAASNVAGDICFRVAVAVTRFRLEHGRLPKDLAELVPRYLVTVPFDPFDGQPIRYISQGDAPRIYSVWLNGVDEGGVERNDGKGQGDLVVQIPNNPIAATQQ